MKPAKILRIPLRAVETLIENKTGLDLDISEIFYHRPESGNASNAVLAVSMLDGFSARILWDPNGFVSTSELISVVQSILRDRPDVESIHVYSQPTSSRPPVKSSEPFTASTSGGKVTISSEPIQMDLFEGDQK